MITDTLQVISSQQKVDDDDGHFIVLENTDLTDRCKDYTFEHDSSLQLLSLLGLIS